MVFKLYKTHKAPDGSLGYTYSELYSKVIQEWNLKPIPTIGAMATEASNIIKNYLVKEGRVNRIIDKKGHIRYVPYVTRDVIKPINLGTDVSTGYNVYALPDEKKFAVIDENWNVMPSPKTRYVRITITTTFSLDTGGGNQRLKFYEATAFVTVPYTTDVVSTAEELQDFIRSVIAYYFNPGVAEASEIKVGVEIMSSPPEESTEPTAVIEYGHQDTKSGGYSTLKKTASQMASEKLGGFNPHAGFGRPPKQKKLKEFKK